MENTAEECECACINIYVSPTRKYAHTNECMNVLQYFVMAVSEGQIILFLNLLKIFPFFI